MLTEEAMNKDKKPFRALLICLVFTAILLGAALSQAQNITGTIVGTVLDSSGAVMPSVTVTIETPKGD